MSIPDDEQFKSYLKEFRPIAPESLRTKKHSVATRRVFVLAAGATACLAALVVALLLVPHRQKPSQPAEAKESLADAPQLATLQASRPIASTPQLHMSTPVLTKLALDDSQAFDALLTNESRTRLPRMQSERSALRVLAKEYD